MTSSLLISPTAERELPALMALLGRCVERMRSQGIDQWDEIYPDAAAIQRNIASGSLYCLRAGDTPAGMIVLNEEQDAEYAKVAWEFSGRVLVAHRLAVDPAFQGRGCARRLMLFAEEFARNNGYHAIRLDSFPLNAAAMALYPRLGYRHAGVVTFRKGLFYCFEKRVAQSPLTAPGE
jgi:ribosomal protein S18 acetylase RimI-like enzyme